MPLLVTTAPDIADALSFGIGARCKVVESIALAEGALVKDRRTTLVVVGPDVALEDALAFAEAQRVRLPALGVVLVRARVDTSVLTQAMRAGIREVVKTDDVHALSEACRRSEALSAEVLGATTDGPLPDGPLGTIVTVFSSKGGCGKTTMATNTAAALAMGGKRRVCLLDLDLAFGDVAIALQMFPERTIADAVALGGKLDVTGVRSLLTTHPLGFDAILAPVEPGASETIPSVVVTELLGVLRTLFDVVVIDTPPSFTDHVLAAFDQTDHFVLLATLDVPALKNLKLTLETMQMLHYPRERWHVVVNRADSKVGLSVADIEKTLSTTVDAQVPSSRAVPASINRGVPIVTDQPNHSVSGAIRKFAETLVPVTTAAPKPVTPDAAAEAPKPRPFSALRKRGAHA